MTPSQAGAVSRPRTTTEYNTSGTVPDMLKSSWTPMKLPRFGNTSTKEQSTSSERVRVPVAGGELEEGCGQGEVHAHGCVQA